ncbi:MAG TPA: TadE/TadG family type IV pilus assembly protein [Bryobacteraceae bacterium]
MESMTIKGSLAGVARRRRRSQSGNALIESAFFFPIIIFMCMGVVDYSRLFALNEQAVSAARAGADVAMYTPANYTASSVSSAAITALTDAASADAGTHGPNVNPVGTVFYSCANTDGTDGSYVTTMPTTCSNGLRIYVQVKTWITSNSVASYPAIVYPTKVYGTAVVRVQ